SAATTAAPYPHRSTNDGGESPANAPSPPNKPPHPWPDAPTTYATPPPPSGSTPAYPPPKSPADSATASPSYYASTPTASTAATTPTTNASKTHSTRPPQPPTHRRTALAGRDDLLTGGLGLKAARSGRPKHPGEIPCTKASRRLQREPGTLTSHWAPAPLAGLQNTPAGGVLRAVLPTKRGSWPPARLPAGVRQCSHRLGDSPEKRLGQQDHAVTCRWRNLG